MNELEELIERMQELVEKNPDIDGLTITSENSGGEVIMLEVDRVFVHEDELTGRTLLGLECSHGSY